MVKQREIYFCPICGNVVEVEYGTSAPLACCGETMKQFIERTGNPDDEKHVPYIERADGGVIVKVGKNSEHPMTLEHYIIYIEIFADGVFMRKYLRPGDRPEAFFRTDAKDIKAWELCNKHGLWSYSEQNRVF